MGNLLATLSNTAASMEAFQTGLGVVSNNVANANSPGFARQEALFEARRFDISRGLTGGVSVGELLNSRQTFLERSVFDQVQRLGRVAQRTSGLEQIESVFDVTRLTGIGGAMDGLFNAFSQLSVSPNDAGARQGVLRAAGLLSGAFLYTSDALRSAAGANGAAIKSSTDAVNAIGARLRQFNVNIRKHSGVGVDPGVEAQVYSAFEELAEHVDFSVLRGKDGTFSVSIGGQTPLTIGERFFPIEADLGTGMPVIRNSEGADITSQILGGRIRGALDFAGTVLPRIEADLNLLAKTIADRVNTTLQAGVDSSGAAPVIGLFSYNSASDAASTFGVTAIAGSELAAALASAPGGNGNALELAAAGNSVSINGLTFARFYGGIAGFTGGELAASKGERYTQTLLVSQAHALRTAQSGVSLDEEAAKVIEFQRAYQASAELVRVINSLADSLLGMI
jgi:flagellar hook-associated protein 1 FlgK